MRCGKLGFRYFIVSLWLRTLFLTSDGVEAEDKVRVFIVSAVCYKTCTLNENVYSKHVCAESTK